MKAKSGAVLEIRAFNRFYTGILGLLDKTLLKSPYSLTEVRVLYEIGHMQRCTANMLIEKLQIDRGYLSRMLKGFAKNGLIYKKNAPEDARKSLLSLTPTGKELLLEMDKRSNEQVLKLIQNLSSSEVEALLASMRQIQGALDSRTERVSIRPYRAEDIGYVIHRHRQIYEEEYGFNSTFGGYVEEHIKIEFGRDNGNTRKNLWIAEYNGQPVGMIAIVEADRETAQLRYFLIERKMRGKGIGHKLMRTVVDFCREKGYKRCFLLTVNVLAAARHLYGVYGFTLTESIPNGEWREGLVDERWDLVL